MRFDPKKLKSKIKKHLPKERTFSTGFFDHVNAEKAFYNHFGTEDIPPRPFLQFDQDKAAKLVRKAIVSDGDTVSLIKVGLTAMIQENIVDLRTPANAESTIKKKGSSNPLIDTGAMRQAVNTIEV